MADSAISRRRLLGMLGAVGFGAAAAGCGSSVGGGGGSASPRGGAIKVGLVIPQAGVYAPLGTDMKRAWDLWLERSGNKLGDYTVTTITADEGETPRVRRSGGELVWLIRGVLVWMFWPV